MTENVCKVLPTDEAYILFVDRKVKEMHEDIECWDGGISWDYIKEEFDHKDVEILAYFVNDVIRGICFVAPAQPVFPYLPSEFKISHWIEMDWEVRQGVSLMLDYMTTHYPKMLLEWDQWFDEMYRVGFKESSLLFEKGEYYLDYHDRPMIYGESVTFVKECYEEYHARGEILEVFATVKNHEELELEVYNKQSYATIPCYRKHSNQTAFLGFHYFNPDLFSYASPKYPAHYMTVYVRERKRDTVVTKMVGIMRIGKTEGYKPYQCISYIDVHWDYRRMGVATKIYETLNEWLSPDDILVSTDPSEEGKAANIQAVRKRMITKCEMYDNERQFNDALYCKG